MIQELDIVKLRHNLTSVDLDGDAVSLSAGSEGTVLASSSDAPECVVEFDDKSGSSSMPTINKADLQLVWSHKQSKSAS